MQRRRRRRRKTAISRLCCVRSKFAGFARNSRILRRGSRRETSPRSRHVLRFTSPLVFTRTIRANASVAFSAIPTSRGVFSRAEPSKNAAANSTRPRRHSAARSRARNSHKHSFCRDDFEVMSRPPRIQRVPRRGRRRKTRPRSRHVLRVTHCFVFSRGFRTNTVVLPRRFRGYVASAADLASFAAREPPRSVDASSGRPPRHFYAFRARYLARNRANTTRAIAVESN